MLFSELSLVLSRCHGSGLFLAADQKDTQVWQTRLDRSSRCIESGPCCTSFEPITNLTRQTINNYNFNWNVTRLYDENCGSVGFFPVNFFLTKNWQTKTPKYSLTTILRWPETLKAAGILAPMNIGPKEGIPGKVDGAFDLFSLCSVNDKKKKKKIWIQY